MTVDQENPHKYNNKTVFKDDTNINDTNNPNILYINIKKGNYYYTLILHQNNCKKNFNNHDIDVINDKITSI